VHAAWLPSTRGLFVWAEVGESPRGFRRRPGATGGRAQRHPFAAGPDPLADLLATLCRPAICPAGQAHQA